MTLCYPRRAAIHGGAVRTDAAAANGVVGIVHRKGAKQRLELELVPTARGLVGQRQSDHAAAPDPAPVPPRVPQVRVGQPDPLQLGDGRLRDLRLGPMCVPLARLARAAVYALAASDAHAPVRGG